MTTSDQEQDQVDVGALLKSLAEAAQASLGSPVPLATGTFAFYPMADGGLMVVTAVSEGPMAGTHHHRLAPGLIRAVAAITGTGPMGAIKGLFKRKAIGQ